MENPASENSYEEAKRKAKELYGKIGCVWCPTLGEYIIFNKAGLRHLMRKGKMWRPKNEQKRRFALLPFAKIILESSITCVVIRQEQSATFWSFSGEQHHGTITLVVRQINGGRKHFFSIF
jgi:hypothetical protein